MNRDAIVALSGLILGLGIGWFLWRPEPPVVEPHAPAIELKNGGLVLEREPEARAPILVVDAIKELGRGAELERAVSVTVKPKEKATDEIQCPPVTLDLGIVKMPDETRRVIATSPDGEIIGGLDIPTAPAKSFKQLKWAAGAVYDPQYKDYGAFVDRDIGPFRVGVEVIKSRVDGDLTGLVRVGIRF